MIKVFSYPFNVDTVNNSFAKVDTDSDAYKAQQIAAFVQTHRKERFVMQEFGIDDPTFDEFDAEAMAEGFHLFYPNSISLTDIEVEQIEGATSAVHVTYE